MEPLDLLKVEAIGLSFRDFSCSEVIPFVLKGFIRPNGDAYAVVDCGGIGCSINIRFVIG